MIRRDSGFTVIELIAVTLLIAAASILFFVQKNNVQIAARDEVRKTAINAIYYNLEEVFYAKNQFYPPILEAKDLPAMDPELLKDTNGTEINDDEAYSEYQYEPENCENDKCKSYTLRVALQNENEYVKKSRHK